MQLKHQYMFFERQFCLVPPNLWTVELIAYLLPGYRTDYGVLHSTPLLFTLQSKMMELTNNLEDISMSDLRALLIASEWKFTDWLQDVNVISAVIKAISTKVNEVKAMPEISIRSKENHYIRAMLRCLTEFDFEREL